MTNPALPTRDLRADRQCQRALGKALARNYESATAAPVPEEFVNLLASIDQKRAATPQNPKTVPKKR